MEIEEKKEKKEKKIVRMEQGMMGEFSRTFWRF